MKDRRVANVVRERGYEVLFLLASCVAASLRPTLREAIDLDHRIGEILMRRKDLKSLRDQGLVASGGRGGEQVLRLTEAGLRSFSGGRDPDKEWGREWDGQWRLLVFDLPRDAGGVRTRFWRWLRSCHLGRLQGSVWIGCDPVPELAQATREAGLEPSTVMVFRGAVEGRSRPLEIVGEAWDFDAINAGYADYMDFAARTVARVGSGPASQAVIKSVLAEDRRKWWRAVRSDPLLPKVLLPKGYKGVAAWKQRQQLHGKLFGAADLDEL